MLIAAALVVMTTVISDSRVDQQPVHDAETAQHQEIAPEEKEFLEQLEFLEVLDMLKAPAIDQAMDMLLPQKPEKPKKQEKQ